MIEGIYQFNWTNDGEWLKSKISYIRTEDTCGFVAVDKNQRRVGAVIFDNFLHSSAQCSLIIDSPKAIKLGLLECGFDFLFNTCKRKYLFAMVAANNTRSIRLTERVGFRPCLIIPEGYNATTDMIVYRVSRESLSFKPKAKRGMYELVE